MSPIHPSCIFSAAADGSVRMNDLNSSNSHERILHNNDVYEPNIIHMFTFDATNPCLLYIAEDRGSISRVDYRCRDPSQVVYSLPEDVSGRNSIKMIVQNQNEKQLLVGASRFTIRLIDLRRIPSSTQSSYHYCDMVVKRWGPQYYGEYTKPSLNVSKKGLGSNLIGDFKSGIIYLCIYTYIYFDNVYFFSSSVIYAKNSYGKIN
jgi:hypothetical protein